MDFGVTICSVWIGISTEHGQDPLTKVLNRRSASRKLKRIQKMVATDHTTAAIVMLDVDKFKSINTNYGHSAGDQVLAAVAGRLRRSVKPKDTIWRHGGDEFGVVLLDVNQKQMQQIVERFEVQFLDPIVINTGEGQERVVVSITTAARLIISQPWDSMLTEMSLEVTKKKGLKGGKFPLETRRKMHVQHPVSGLSEGTKDLAQ